MNKQVQQQQDKQTQEWIKALEASGHKVYITHHRRFFQFDQVTGQRRWLITTTKSIHKVRGRWTVSNYGGQTAVTIYNLKNNVSKTFVSECSLKDHFRNRTGVFEALVKAVGEYSALQTEPAKKSKTKSGSVPTVEELRKNGWDVKVQHFRNFYRYDQKTGKKLTITQQHAKGQAIPDGYQLSTKGGLTIVTIDNNFVGLSNCSLKDTYSRKHGVTEALKRAYADLNR